MAAVTDTSTLARFLFLPYFPDAKLRICVTGAGGFIASALGKRLKKEGHYVVACDWKRNEHMAVSWGRRGAGVFGGLRPRMGTLPGRTRSRRLREQYE